MVLHLHRAPRTDLLADALGELLATPLDDPFATELVVVPAQGVERWLTQRLSHRLGAGGRGAGDGVCAGVEFRSAAVAGRRADRHPRATTRGPPTRWSGRCSRSSTTASTSRGAAALARHLGHGDAGDEARAPARPPLRRGAPARRPVRVVRRAAAAAARRLARRAATPTVPAAALDADLAWQPELWRRLLDAESAAARPHVRHAATPRARLDAAEPSSTCRRGSRCSATPGCRSPRSSCSARWASTATCTSGCRTPPRAVARAAPTSPAGAARRDDVSHRAGPAPAARLARPRRPRAAAQPRAPAG